MTLHRIKTLESLESRLAFNPDADELEESLKVAVQLIKEQQDHIYRMGQNLCNARKACKGMNRCIERLKQELDEANKRSKSWYELANKKSHKYTELQALMCKQRDELDDFFSVRKSIQQLADEAKLNAKES